MNDSGVQSFLAENEWQIEKGVDGVLRPGTTIIRKIVCVPQMDLDQAVIFLKCYCSVKNYPTPSLTVVDPVVDRKNDRTGTWRNLSVTVQRDGQGRLCLYQELAFQDAGAQFLFASVRTGLMAEDTRVYQHVSSKVEAPADGVGATYDASCQANLEDGTYDGRIQYKKPIARNVEWTAERDAVTETRILVERNADGAADAPAPAAGQQYDQSNELTDARQYNRRTVLKVAVARTTFVQEETLPAGEGRVGAYQYENAAAVPGDLTNVARRMYEKRFHPNGFSRYDGTLVVKETESLAFGPQVVGRDAGLATTQYVYENRDQAVDVPESAQGSASFGRNVKDGTWTGVLRIRADGGGSAWWGGDGDWVFVYSAWIRDKDHFIYVYDKYTRSQDTAEDWINDGAQVASAVVIGENMGHRTDIHPLGQGRLWSRRVEALKK